MMTQRQPGAHWFAFALGTCLIALPACTSPGQRARTIQENEALRNDKQRLERTVAQCDGQLAALQQQIENLKQASPDRPLDLFAPVKLEMARLSGGADYDDKPGDDGVTVYLRPRDAEGDAVKVPGRIRIQLSDQTDLAKPRVIGVYVIDDPEELKKSWHGRFGTQHYSIKCPFPPGTVIPASRRVTVHAEFVDYLTGRTLTVVEEVEVARVDSLGETDRPAQPR